MTEQAAQDPNMPELDEVEVTEQTVAEVEAVQEGQAETAPATVEETEGGFVDTDNDAIQKRINKITAEKYAEKRRADELERKLKEREAPQVQTQNAEPKLEDFDYDDAAYNRAMIQYEVGKVRAELQDGQKQEEQKRAQQTRENNFNDKVSEFKKTATDYEQVVSNIPELPEQTLNAVMLSEKAPELAYYLGKHLDVADQIATMDPISAAMKLGQISAQLSAPIKTVKPSAAPEPIEPVNSGGVSNKTLEDMSMEEIYNM